MLPGNFKRNLSPKHLFFLRNSYDFSKNVALPQKNNKTIPQVDIISSRNSYFEFRQYVYNSRIQWSFTACNSQPFNLKHIYFSRQCFSASGNRTEYKYTVGIFYTNMYWHRHTYIQYIYLYLQNITLYLESNK